MKIHEYQARDLLSSFGIPVPAGSVIKDANDAANAYTEVTQAAGTDLAVVKAQVFAGGRGKAGFVKLVRSATEATAAADFMLSNKMVSAQTGAEGLDVNTLLVAAGVDIADRKSNKSHTTPQTRSSSNPSTHKSVSSPTKQTKSPSRWDSKASKSAKPR